MAIIGKIRKQSTVLLIAVGGAMILFVLSDLLGSGGSMFTGPDDKVGEINGTKITYREFEQKVKRAVETRLGGSANNDQIQQLRNQVWEDMIRENTLDRQLDALGLGVSDREIFHTIKNDPQNQILRSYFTDPQTGQLIQRFSNPNGTVNTDAVLSYFQQVLSVDPSEQPEAADAQRSFRFLIDNMRTMGRDSKYGYLISTGLYATNLEIEKADAERGRKHTVQYAMKRYSSMTGDEFTPTESELKKYFNEVKSEARFKQKEPIRSVEYVVFDVIATPGDTQSAYNSLKDMIQPFSYATDDTLFVNENGDTPFNVRWQAGYNLPEDQDTIIMNADTGAVIGPYLNGDKFELSKILDFKTGPDSVKARHILVGFPQEGEVDTAEIRNMADSLKTAIREEGADFGMLAGQFSSDQGSREDGGELDWFTEGKMVKPFNDFCFDNKPGEIGLVTSQFGIHIVEIMDQTPDVKKVLLATVDDFIEPSQQTYQDVYSEANNFALNNKNADDFLENGEMYGSRTAPTVRKGDRNLEGLENSREIIRWIYENEAGDVSQVFDLQGEYVVALITEVREKGQLPFEMAKDVLVKELTNKKKAAKAIEEVKNASTPQEAANNWGVKVETSQTFTFNDFSISGLGVEPKIQGKAFALNSGESAGPIEGNSGVYFITLQMAQDAPGGATRQDVEQPMATNAATRAEQAIKDRASVKDNRIKFY